MLNKYVLLTFELIVFSCITIGHPLVEYSEYTKSCTHGSFQVKKLDTAIKVNRYADTISESTDLSLNIIKMKDSDWYRYASTEQWEMPKLHKKITKQSSFEMIHQELQKYMATIHLIILTKRTDGARQNKMISDFKGLLKDIQRLMCIVEGIINGTNAELDSTMTQYKYIDEDVMNDYLEELHREIKLKPLIVGTIILDQLTEFNFLIQEIAITRLNNINENLKRISQTNKE